MFLVSWGAGSGFGVAGADGDAVVDGLDPGRCELDELESGIWMGCVWFLRLGGRTSLLGRGWRTW